MAYTVADLVSEVQSKINDTSFSSTDLVAYCDKTNARIHNRYRMKYMEATQNYTLTIGSDSLGTLPIDFQTAIDLRIVSPITYGNKLNYIEYESFDDAFPVPSLAGNGVPYLWYIFNTATKVYPQADAAYQLTLRYLKTPTKITASSQTPDVPEQFREVLFLGMYSQALEKKDRFDQSQVVNLDFETKLLEMVNRVSDRQLDRPVVMRSSNRRVGWH